MQQEILHLAVLLPSRTLQGLLCSSALECMQLNLIYVFIVNKYQYSSQHITGQVITIDGARSLTSSGWTKWEGMRCMDEAMEQLRPSYWKKIKNFFNDQRKNFVAATNLSNFNLSLPVIIMIYQSK